MVQTKERKSPHITVCKMAVVVFHEAVRTSKACTDVSDFLCSVGVVVSVLKQACKTKRPEAKKWKTLVMPMLAMNNVSHVIPPKQVTWHVAVKILTGMTAFESQSHLLMKWTLPTLLSIQQERLVPFLLQASSLRFQVRQKRTERTRCTDVRPISQFPVLLSLVHPGYQQGCYIVVRIIHVELSFCMTEEPIN
jgi:hypothetical protein